MTMQHLDSRRKQELGAAGVVSALMIVLTALVYVWGPAARNQIPELTSITVFPDFASTTNVDVKKQQFFDYLQDYVEAEIANISAIRSRLEMNAELLSADGQLSESDRVWVRQLARDYEIDPDELGQQELFAVLLRRVDILPVSLALAQAANESAWGSSRFALEGNSLFGQWCYEKGCGMVPLNRREGATHEVRRFDSIAGTISGYFRNINTHPSYQALREMREEMRKRGQAMDALRLASGLGEYSERGDHYVDEVQTIIRQNNLLQRDS